MQRYLTELALQRSDEWWDQENQRLHAQIDQLREALDHAIRLLLAMDEPLRDAMENDNEVATYDASTQASYDYLDNYIHGDPSS